MSFDDIRSNARKRSDRMRAARAIGSHTKQEWEALKAVFHGCVICGSTDKLCKDHIEPVYQGGCDCLGNIQPLCRSCNSRKGPEDVDYRPFARRNWFREFMAELGMG
jgi:5-methylcytosine-specific restriction endonuclease McrA